MDKSLGTGSKTEFSLKFSLADCIRIQLRQIQITYCGLTAVASNRSNVKPSRFKLRSTILLILPVKSPDHTFIDSQKSYVVNNLNRKFGTDSEPQVGT